MSGSLSARLRPEIIRIRKDDGGLDLLDLVLERIMPLDAREAELLAGASSPPYLEVLDDLDDLEDPAAPRREGVDQGHGRRRAESMAFATSQQSGDAREPTGERG